MSLDCLNLFANFKPAHPGHEYVQNDQVNLRSAQLLQGGTTVRCGNHLEALAGEQLFASAPDLKLDRPQPE